MIPLPNSHSLVRGSRPYLSGYCKFKQEYLDDPKGSSLADAHPRWKLDLVQPISYQELTIESDLLAEVILLPNPDIAEEAESADHLSADDTREIMKPKVKRETKSFASHYNSWLAGPMLLPVYITHHQCDQKKSQSVYKSCPKMISLEI